MNRKLNLDPPQFVGNKGVAINSVRNLQRRLNKEDRKKRETERLDSGMMNAK